MLVTAVGGFGTGEISPELKARYEKLNKELRKKRLGLTTEITSTESLSFAELLASYIVKKQTDPHIKMASVSMYPPLDISFKRMNALFN